MKVAELAVNEFGWRIQCFLLQADDKAQPRNVEKPQPGNVEKPQPGNVEKLQPKNVEKPQPGNVEKLQPKNVEKPQPGIAEKPQTQSLEKPPPQSVEKLQPNASKKNVIEDVPEPPPPPKPKLCCSVRLLFSVSSFLAMFSAAYVRASGAMIIVCMVSHDHPNYSGSARKYKEFSWPPSTKGYLMSAIFYGLLIGPSIAGFLVFRYGGKIILIIGIFGTAIFHFIMPETTRLTYIMFFVGRVMIGFLSGFIIPSFHGLAARWIPSEESQYLLTGVFLGIPLANALNFPITGTICHYLGWVWIFYIFGIWMSLLGTFLCFTIFNRPEYCKFIKQKELRYLTNRIFVPKKYKIPLKSIMKSVPVYAYLIMHCCTSFVFLTLIFAVPIFMEKSYSFSLQLTGWMSATPFLGSLFIRLLITLFYERLRLKLKVSKNTIRKVFTFSGAFLASTFLFIITWLPFAETATTLSCFVLAACCLELCITGGYFLSWFDLCPHYADILSGFASTIANFAGMISPVVSGYLTSHNVKEEWNIVFYVNIGLIICATTIYMVFGQNRLQSWGRGSESSATLT